MYQILGKQRLKQFFSVYLFSRQNSKLRASQFFLFHAVLRQCQQLKTGRIGSAWLGSVDLGAPP